MWRPALLSYGWRSVFVLLIILGHCEAESCPKNCICIKGEISCNTTDFNLHYANSTLKIKCSGNMSDDKLRLVNEFVLTQNIAKLQLDECRVPDDKPLNEALNIDLNELASLVIKGKKTYKYTVKQMLKGLKNIKNLTLDNLGLSNSEELNIEGIEQLDKLSLTRNKFTEVPQLKRDGSSIQYLDISYNNLSTFEGGKNCKHFSNLKHLDISGNKKMEIANSFEGCKFSELHLADTGLETIHKQLWGLEDLLILNISSNNFKTISMDNLMASWNTLADKHISIYLSKSNINKIEVGVGSFTNNIKTLKMLDLSQNKLATINDKVLDILNTTGFVSKFKLGGNPWLCDLKLLNVVKFVKENEHKIIDIEKMKCINRNDLVKNMTKETLMKATDSHVTAWIMGFLAIGLLCSVGGILYYRSTQRRR